MDFILRILLSLSLLMFLLTYHGSSARITFPPILTQQPDKEIAYKVDDVYFRVTKLPCVAQGDPEPEYFWEKDGKRLEILGVSYRRQLGEGTLIIEDQQDDHEGIYQCFAKNEHGTAVSVKTWLRKATLEPFDYVYEPYVHHPEIGSYLVLRCHPPKSYPAGNLSLGISRPGDKFTVIPEDDRVSLDYDGNLHISNVKMIDYQEGKTYTCIVKNNYLRGLVQGEDAKIQPKAASPPYKAPILVWSSPTTTVGLHGLQHKMKCIFAGFPTPKVKWERIDGEIDLNRVNPNKKFGLEMEFEPLEFKDNGTYRCSASNKDGEFLRQMFTLKVESMPYWVREMENVNTADGDDAEFECHPGGSPPPSVSWMVDGIPIEQLDVDDRRTLLRSKLIFRNVTKADSQVIQCNATNKHGYIFANAYLNVLAEPPTFILSPAPVTKKAVGQDATISCRVFGAPDPKITWFFDDQEINNPRFSVNKDGDLEIKSLVEADRGAYKCLAENKFGASDAQGTLFVQQRTLNTVFPENKDVNASTDVVFECEPLPTVSSASEALTETRKDTIIASVLGTLLFLALLVILVMCRLNNISCQKKTSNTEDQGFQMGDEHDYDYIDPNFIPSTLDNRHQTQAASNDDSDYLSPRSEILEQKEHAGIARTRAEEYETAEETYVDLARSEGSSEGGAVSRTYVKLQAIDDVMTRCFEPEKVEPNYLEVIDSKVPRVMRHQAKESDSTEYADAYSGPRGMDVHENTKQV